MGRILTDDIRFRGWQRRAVPAKHYDERDLFATPKETAWLLWNEGSESKTASQKAADRLSNDWHRYIPPIWMGIPVAISRLSCRFGDRQFEHAGVTLLAGPAEYLVGPVAGIYRFPAYPNGIVTEGTDVQEYTNRK